MKLISVILISLLVFSSIGVKAQEIDSNKAFNDLSRICQIDSNLKEEFYKIKKDKEYSFSLENYAQKLREKCVDNEVNNYLEENQTQADYDKAKLFLEAIGPFQVYPTTRQFNSVSWGVGVSNLIQQLNRFVRADNWICLPNFTNDWLSKELKDKIGLDCVDYQLIDLSPILKQIVEFAVLLSVPFIMFFCIYSFTQKDKLGYIFKNISGLILKISLIGLSGIFFSALIFGINSSNVLIFNIFNTTSVDCKAESGIACVSTQMLKSVQKMDFIKLKATDLQEPVKNLSFIDFAGKAINNGYKSDALWTTYYLILFIFIGGISFYCALSFASSQILIWIRLIIHFISSYLSLLLPSADISQILKKTGNLALNSIANVASYTLLIYFVTSIFKNGLTGPTIFLLVMIFLGYGTLNTYFFTILQIKALKKDGVDTSYKAIYDKAKSTIINSKNKAKEGINEVNKSIQYGKKKTQQIGSFLKKFKKK